MTILRIDAESTVPPFEQIRSQLVVAIKTGQLEPEDQLPTVRKLAADLGLAANTVARAYRELELAGIIVTRGRHGTFVAGSLPPKKEAGVRSAAAFVQRMRELGIGDAEMLAIIRNEIDRHRSPSQSRLRPTS
jgi:DNA-binding transcriptional regulator YhcF (GntR family)